MNNNDIHVHDVDYQAVISTAWEQGYCNSYYWAVLCEKVVATCSHNCYNVVTTLSGLTSDGLNT